MVETVSHSGKIPGKTRKCKMTLKDLLNNTKRLFSTRKYEIDHKIIYRETADKVLYTIYSNGKPVEYANSLKRSRRLSEALKEKHVPSVLKALKRLNRLGLGTAEVIFSDNCLIVRTDKSKYTFRDINMDGVEQ